MGDGRSLPQPGQLLVGKYRVERLLGQGGMGAVFAASHELLGQRVAVKVLLSDMAGSPEGQQRFLNEARAAARLDSEHVARVMDVGMLESGLPYMVLEYLEGGDLAQTLEARGKLPVAEAVDYLIQTCEALAQAHGAGIVHRDLKPSNLYLARRQDGTSRVKVLDFGISKISEGAQAPKALTQTSSMLGTPHYMSPEQFVAPKSVDLRTDIWQMGIILYELVSGGPPFGGETFGQVMFASMQGPLPSLSTARPDVPKGLAQVFARCVEREASKRFGSAVELAVALAPFGTGAQRALVERMQRGHASPNEGLVTGTAGARTGQTGAFGASGHTTASWGASSQHDAPRPRSRTPLFLGIAAFVVLAAGGFVVAATQLRQHGGPVASPGIETPSTGVAVPPPPIASATAAATLAPPVASAAPDPPPAASVAATSAPPTPTAAPRPAATFSAASPVAPTPTATGHKPATSPRQSRPADQLPDNSRQ